MGHGGRCVDDLGGTGMGKACFYRMRTDKGFAPNPFHGVCTLAACTPNHCHAKLTRGDLIAGCSRSDGTVRVVYVMEVDEVLGLDDYYRDPRFKAKKPSSGTRIRRAGDNIYVKDGGKWRQDPDAFFHRQDEDPRWFRQDTGADRVFVGRRFVYFGSDMVKLPARFAGYLPFARGIRFLKDDPKTFAAFRRWAFSRPKLGRLGAPGAWKAESGGTCDGSRPNRRRAGSARGVPPLRRARSCGGRCVA